MPTRSMVRAAVIDTGAACRKFVHGDRRRHRDVWASCRERGSAVGSARPVPLLNSVCAWPLTRSLGAAFRGEDSDRFCCAANV
jgi:hypothetical protein